MPKLSAPLPRGGAGGGALIPIRSVSFGMGRMAQRWAHEAYDAQSPQGLAWRALDPESVRMAAGPMFDRLTKVQQAELLNYGALSEPRRASLSAELKAAAQAAGVELARAAQSAVDALGKAIAEGHAGASELAWLERDLRALVVYGPEISARHREVSDILRQHRELVVASALAKHENALKDKKGGAMELGAQALTALRAPLKKPSAAQLGKGAKIVGYGLLGASALAALDPSIAVESVGPLHGILTYTGIAAFGLGRFLDVPKDAVSAERSTLAQKSLPGWVEKYFGTFLGLWKSSKQSAELHRGFEAKVGGGSFERFRTWLASAGRTALYWLPLALLGMFGGWAIGYPAKFFGAVKAASMTPEVASEIAAIPLAQHLNGYMALEVLRELFVLGVVFAGLSKLLARWTTLEKARWITGALVLAGTLAAAMMMGIPFVSAMPIVGFEAVILALYARSGSLLVSVGLKAAFVFFAIDSARMLAFLKVPTLGGALFMPPAAAGLIVLGVSAALFAATAAGRHWLSRGWGFLKTGVKAEYARLKAVGEWWTAPTEGGAPRRLLPMLATGLFWAIPTFLVMDFAYHGTQFFHPQSEPAPEILRRLIFMPLDVLLYNFVIVAALEEWVFRKGVHKAIYSRLKLAGKQLFWPAAILSSLIFSAAHYVDWASMLAAIGIGDGNLAGSLAQTYAFTWAGFLARTAGGMMLAFLYHRSGLLLVPMIAHFGSNLLESVGLRWGFAYFLAGVALIFALQWLRGSRVPKIERPA